MNPIVISTDRLSRSADTQDQTLAGALNQRTRFVDIPLQARMLLAVPRIRGKSPTAPLAERYVLDALGRVIDAGPMRHNTIQAVNLLAEVLLTPSPFADAPEETDDQWLSSVENLVLCVLCKIRGGQTQAAKQLTQHWLTKTSIESFNVAAEALCDAQCFKQAGPDVFSPSLSGTVEQTLQTQHSSVTLTQDLHLVELLLLNALRLRMRTLAYPGIAVRVIPILSKHLAIPKIESIIDALLIESLQYSDQTPDVRCLCFDMISCDESEFLGAIAAFSTGNRPFIKKQLSSWLPTFSVDRLVQRSGEFQSIIAGVGLQIPLRNWNKLELSHRNERDMNCAHANETAMIH
ncbi:MAG: hypothetical protein AB8B79_04260 [Granulosicoccus sp.]